MSLKAAHLSPSCPSNDLFEVPGDRRAAAVASLVFADAGDKSGCRACAEQVLDRVTSGVDLVIPGHGTVAVGDQLRARIDQDRAYLHALRDGRAPDDARIVSAAPGWEWVSDIHAGQAESVARRRERGTP